MRHFRNSERAEISEDNSHTRQEVFLFRMIFILESLLITTQMDSCLSRLSAKFAAMPDIKHTLYIITATVVGYLAMRFAVRTITRNLPSIIFSEQTGYCKTKNMVIVLTATFTLAITVSVLTLCVLKML